MRFFKELIYRVDTENPKAFGLTADIKSLFKNGKMRNAIDFMANTVEADYRYLTVTTGATGDFIDIQEHRPPSKIT